MVVIMAIHDPQKKPKYVPAEWPPAVDRIMKILGELDSGKDGRISKDELKKALKKLGAFYPGSLWRANSCFRMADANNHGHIHDDELEYLIQYAFSHGYVK